jgi:hypothetical protein
MTDGIFFNHEENEFSRRGSGFAEDVHHGVNALERNARADNRQGTKEKPTQKKKRASCAWHG